MPHIEAEELLDSARKGEVELNADGWYNLTLIVTGSEEAAQQAYSEYIKRKLRANETPE